MREREHRSLKTLPSATGGLSRIAFARARKAGIELAPLLKKAGLTAKEINDRSTRISVHRQIRFLNLISDALRDPLLGFHLAESFDLRELGLVYYVAASSDTLGDALRRAARYSSITNEGLSLSYVGGRKSRLVVRYVGVPRHSDTHQMEFAMTALLRLCRQFVGKQLMPHAARFTHAGGSKQSPLAAFYGGNVHFAAGTDEIVFAGAIEELPVLSADRYLNEILEKNGEIALARQSLSRGPFRVAVENAIVPLLPHGKARAANVAKALGLSQRTAARRLANEGVTFSEVLENMRKALASHHLQDQGMSISRIAWLLGYQEVSAFTHAYKRWTGKTPRAARA